MVGNKGRLVGAVMCVLAVAGGCTSSNESASTPSEGSSSETVEGVESVVGDPVAVEVIANDPTPDGRITMSWVQAAGATRYRLRVGRSVFDVPSSICGSSDCDLTLDALTVNGGDQLVLSGIWPDGEVGPASTVDLDPIVGVGLDFDEVEVMIGHFTEGTMVYEVQPVDSLAEAVDLIESFHAEGVVAGLNLPGSTLTSHDDDTIPELPDEAGLATWQEQALDYELLPTQGTGVTVAVIDDGVDPNHPALVGANILPGTSFTSSDTKPSGDGITTPGPHGTSVVSLIAAQPGSPIPAPAPKATILPIDIDDPGNGINVARLNAAIVWAVDNGADVINVSLAFYCIDAVIGFVGCPGGVGEAVAYAESHGVVIVAGAGNNGDGASRCDGGSRFLGTRSNADVWPAVEPNVLSVGGVNRNGDVWECSPDRGDVDILAPAGPLLVADTETATGYSVGEGTSFASPIIAGIAAAVIADNPIAPAELRDGLTETRRPSKAISVPNALTALGYPNHSPFFDWTTQQTRIPINLQVMFPPGHPQHVANAGTELVACPPDSGCPLRIAGTITVDTDNLVTGQGLLIPGGGIQYSGGGTSGPNWDINYNQGFQVSCGTTATNPAWFVWTYEIPVTITGTVTNRDTNGDISVMDLVFTLGNGPDHRAGVDFPALGEPGTMPNLTVIADTLEGCDQACRPSSSPSPTIPGPSPNTTRPSQCNQITGLAPSIVDATTAYLNQIVTPSAWQAIIDYRIGNTAVITNEAFVDPAAIVFGEPFTLLGTDGNNWEVAIDGTAIVEGDNVTCLAVFQRFVSANTPTFKPPNTEIVANGRRIHQSFIGCGTIIAEANLQRPAFPAMIGTQISAVATFEIPTGADIQAVIIDGNEYPIP